MSGPIKMGAIAALLGVSLCTLAERNPSQSKGKPNLEPTQPAGLSAGPRGFIPNAGQMPDASTKFIYRDKGVTAHLGDRGFVLWTGQSVSVVEDGMERRAPVAPRWEVLGARQVEPIGGARFGHTVSYFLGNNPANWQASLPAYRELRYPEILPGAEMRLETREHGFEYSFHIQPHAKPDLRFRYDGIASLEKTAIGDLMVHTATSSFKESRPVSWQWIDGAKREVESSFEIVSANEYRIVLGAYDARHELVIDPVLDWSTSIGGSYGDQINAIKVDPEGNVVVAGVSHSVNLPTTSGFAPFGTDAGENFGNDPQFPEHSDVYVAKLSPDGTQLLWAGYIGGEGAHPESTGRNKPLAIDSAGDVYITTHTQSPDFPVLPAGSSIHQGGTDASITKIKADGSAILWSRLLGAQGEDHGYAVAIHDNDLYLAGVTTSPNFPVTQRSFGGMQDAFVAKLSAGDGAVAWSAFLGGSMEERISALAATSSGVIVFGDSDSADFHAPDFPAPAGHDRTLGGGNDGFLTKLDPSGGILWSSYLGGSGAETSALVPIQGFTLTWGLSDMTLDSAGNIVAAGHTYSADFPGTSGRYQPALRGTMDGYVAKLSPDASQVLWATYLGGTGPHDRIVGVALNPWDEIFVGGGTSSLDFPTTADALKPAMQADGFQDGFMSKLDRDGQQLMYSTYIGNNGWNDSVLAVDYAFGKALMGGWHFDTFFQITAGTFRQECDNCGHEMFLMSFLDAFIAHDGFESGNYSGGQGDWAGSWSASGDASILTSSGPHSGGRHARLRSGTGYLQRTASVPPGTTTLQLGFWAKVNSFEGSDRADVLVRSGAGSFTTVASLSSAQSDNTYRFYEIDLTGFLPASQIHIAFDAAMNANNDSLYLDDVRLTGTAGSLPPVASAGSDQVVSDGDANGAQTVTLNGSSSSDPDGGSIMSYEWKEGSTVLGTDPVISANLAVGVHTITLTVTDDENESGADSVQITISPNQAPAANAGTDLTASDLDDTGSEAVALSAAASSDSDGSIVSYEWKEGAAVLGTSSSINPSLAVGVHNIVLTVTDNGGATATDMVQVTVDPYVSSAEVFYDSFEVGEWNGLWTEDSQNDWFRSTQRATQGTRSAEVDGSASDASLTSAAINLQGRTSATITFDWLIESGLDNGEYLEFRVSTNGGSSWTQKAILRGNADPENSWRNVAVELTGISQLRLQFRGKMNGSDEDANVDNVRVIAH